MWKGDDRMSGRDVFEGRQFQALLFDMDGTILTSILAAERVWTRWALRHGLDPVRVLATIHGKRSVDSVRALALPGVDAQAESDWITAAEIEDVEGIQPVPGAAEFLAGLPDGRWAVVTSAPRLLAERRIAAAGLPQPPMMISAEDVSVGKPAPDGYRLAAGRLGWAATSCLVFEDAPAGIAAGEAAGAAVVVITAAHASPSTTPHPAFADYRGLVTRTATAGVALLRRS